MTQTTIDFTEFLKRVGVVALTASLLFLAWKAIDVLLLIFFGVLLGVLLITFTSWLTRYTALGWRWALGLVLLLLVALLFGAGLLIGPRISQQVSGFNQQLNQSIQSLEQRLSESSWGRNLLQRAPVLEAPGSEGQAGAADNAASPDAPEQQGVQQGTGTSSGQSEAQSPNLGGAAAVAGNVFSSALNLLSTVFSLFGDMILVVFTAIFCGCQSEDVPEWNRHAVSRAAARAGT